MTYYLTSFQKLLVAVILSVGLVVNNSYCTGIPVVDVLNIVQTTTTALENIQQTMQMVQSFDTQVQQYEQEIKSYQNMSGSYGMGNLLTDSSDTATRRWAPANWQDTLAVIQSGGIPGSNSNINAAMTNNKDKLKMQFSPQVYTTTNGKMARNAAYYDTNVSTNLAAMSLSDAAYSTTDERTDNIDELASHIDSADSMKEAMDLNNRLLVQVLHQQNQMIQIMAMQTEAVTTQNYGTANVQAANADFNTFNPGL